MSVDHDHRSISFLGLPAELVDEVLKYLAAPDLLRISSVCRLLRQHALNDLLWFPLINRDIPSADRNDSESIAAYRHALTRLHPFSFLARHKIWFSDQPYYGKLIVVRYDPRTRSLDGYALSAVPGSKSFQLWSYNPEVIIHTFNPIVRLNTNITHLRIDEEALKSRRQKDPDRRIVEDVPMRKQPIGASGHRYSHFMTACALQDPVHRMIQAWPPHILPAIDRCRNLSDDGFAGKGHKPDGIDDMSQSLFRLKQWTSQSMLSLFGMNKTSSASVSTWATLPAEAYTPTTMKPWRGIWVGDYSGHGCEFLAILQPDDPLPLPEAVNDTISGRRRSVSSTDSFETAQSNPEALEEPDAESEPHPKAEWQPELSAAQQRQQKLWKEEQDAKGIYQGRIEGIKLTGDPNVPRGEYTFIAPDLGDEGFVRVAEEEIFRGARVVKSVGHIAFEGFRRDRFINSQLILISENRIAQYWKTFGHISFYERVDIDQFLRI